MFRLPPMTVPEADATIDRLGQFEAVQLFLDRVTQAKPDFRISDETAPAVAEICSRLDGLPLATELTAAWIRHISPVELLSRLSRRPDILKSSAVDLPARHRTIRATLDWSYDLLCDTGKFALHCLSAFAGSFTVATAEEVCGSLESISSLVDKSLIRGNDCDGATGFACCLWFASTPRSVTQRWRSVRVGGTPTTRWLECSNPGTALGSRISTTRSLRQSTTSS